VTNVTPAAESGSDSESGLLGDLRLRLGSEVSKVVIGQASTVDVILTAMAVGGHVLLEGAPGVAKTLLASAVARTCGMAFRRIQFTPDMLPSDVTGTMTLRGGDLIFRPGPVFTNILLADEINRTPPKTQAALLEAMQEGQVTIEGEPRQLPTPFLVIATENPIEYEGTYPLPEAQLDRFLVKLEVGYPTAEEEIALLQLRREGLRPSTLEDVNHVVTIAELMAARAEVDATAVSDPVIAYVAALVRRTRDLPAVALGASPRAGVHLLSAAKAFARLSRRAYVVPEDVVALAPSVLRHRLVLRAEAELDRFTTDDAVRTALASVPIPR
jgi:MoxR-like ATPase